MRNQRLGHRSYLRVRDHQSPLSCERRPTDADAELVLRKPVAESVLREAAEWDAVLS